jgi:REP element-mobilizing transposase RayT
MPQSLAKIYIHTVFSTKNREPFLTDAALRREIHAYLAAITAELKCHAIRVGGVADHVHLLITLSRTITVADLVKELKRISNAWARQKVSADFYWQAGYGAFSVSQSQLESVAQYIDNQEIHHSKQTFQDKFLEFLRRYQIDYDERYVWD